MSEKFRPASVLDLQVILSERLELPAREIESKFELYEDKGELVVRIRRWLERTEFSTVASLVRGWGGEYKEHPRREFRVPVKPAEAPAVAPKVPEKRGYAAVPEGAVIKVPVDCLAFGKFWVRKHLDPHELSRLRESIRRRGDVTYPLAVRPLGTDRLELLGGHRRERVAKEAGVKHVSVRVWHPETEREAWEIACQDEMHEPWSPVAKARAYQRMKQDGMSIGDISLITGDSTRVIEHLLNLLKLPEPVQDIVDTGKLGPSHAEELLRLKDRPEDLMMLAIETSEGLWTIRRLREEIGRILLLSPKEAQKEVATSGPEKVPEIGKEAEIGEISEGSVGQLSGVGFEPTAETRRSEVPPSQPAVEFPRQPKQREVPVGPPRDVTLERASKYYPLGLIDRVWQFVTIEARRLPFLKTVITVLWERAEQQGYAQQVLEDAKTRFESPEEIRI